MMAQILLNEKFKTGLCPEFAATVTKLENIMVNPHEENRAYKKFYGKIIDNKKYSNNFG